MTILTSDTAIDRLRSIMMLYDDDTIDWQVIAQYDRLISNIWSRWLTSDSAIWSR